MKKEYKSTIDEVIETHFRMGELFGAVRKLKLYGLIVSPVIFIMIFFLIDNLMAVLFMGPVVTALFVWHHLSTYRNDYRKRIRKTIVKALGTEEPVDSVFELDDRGLVFSKLGQEIRFSWDSVKKINQADDTIEVVMEPLAIARIPKRIFKNSEEMEDWIKFIEDHSGTNKAVDATD